MHRFAVEVFYEDTDLSGFVYHANYLRFIERARSDWVRGQGLDQVAMRAAGEVFAVTEIAARFRAPARLHDRLEVHTALHAVRGARLILDQRVARDAVTLFDAQVTLVRMTTAGRPLRLPPELPPK